MWRLAVLIGCVALAAVVSLMPTGQSAVAQACFGTGFCIQNPAFYEYYMSRGQERTLGFPISNEFTLDGFQVQFFQRVVLQMNQGNVARLNVLDPDIMPLTHANASVFPEPDATLAASAPQVGSPTYAQDVVKFVRDVAPNSFSGQPVRFFDTFTNTVPPQPGTPSDTMTLLNLEIWGLPTSQPAADPGNGGFVYQRYQRGIMHFRSECGCTEGILIGEYFKAVITGANLPADLDADMQTSRYYRQYAPGMPNAVARPDQLANTNLSGAFGDLQAPPPVTTSVPSGTATPTPAAGPSVTIQVDDPLIDPGQQISITVIASDPAGVNWIEWEGVPEGRENSNDNSGYVDDPTLARQRFDCDAQTSCANVWTAQPTISSNYILRARARNRDGARSDWVTTTLRIRFPLGTATPTATATGAATALPTATEIVPTATPTPPPSTATPTPTVPAATPTPTATTVADSAGGAPTPAPDSLAPTVPSPSP
jgi:hypothetical protein